MRIGNILERLCLCLCFGLWFLLVSGWVVADEVWLKDNESRFDVSYRLNGAAVTGYRKVMLDPLSVWYADQTDQARVAANVTALQERFGQVFSETLQANGFVLVDNPGEAVLCLHVEIVDLRVNDHSAQQLSWSERFSFPVAPGHMTLVAEVRDTETGDVLLRVADQEDAVESGDLWSLVDQIFAGWAGDIAATLQPSTSGDLLAQR